MPVDIPPSLTYIASRSISYQSVEKVAPQARPDVTRMDFFIGLLWSRPPGFSEYVRR